MINIIGENAGKVWDYLNENETATLVNLKKDLDLKGEQAAFSVGWLAREGCVTLEKRGTSVKVKLNK